MELLGYCLKCDSPIYIDSAGRTRFTGRDCLCELDREEETPDITKSVEAYNSYRGLYDLRAILERIIKDREEGDVKHPDVHNVRVREES